MLLTHQVHAENLGSLFFLLLLPVGVWCKAHGSFKFPVANALKDLFSSCSCFSFFKTLFFAWFVTFRGEPTNLDVRPVFCMDTVMQKHTHTHTAIRSSPVSSPV